MRSQSPRRHLQGTASGGQRVAEEVIEFGFLKVGHRGDLRREVDVASQRREAAGADARAAGGRAGGILRPCRDNGARPRVAMRTAGGPARP